MAFIAETGEHRVTRSDIFVVDPTALVVDWSKNLSRGGQEPPVDQELMDLARDMMPRRGPGDAEDGTTGQLNPVITRPLPDRRLEVVGGFRRMRAALWLIESGTCPDFKVKYVVSRMSDAEAALANISENLQRKDPEPIQMAHAIRALHEDYGMSFAQIAGRLKKSDRWCREILGLVTLPSAIQASVTSGQTPVRAAIELTRLPGPAQVAVFDALSQGGSARVTASEVRAAREANARPVNARSGAVAAGTDAASNGPAAPVRIPRNMRQVRAFFEFKSGPADPGHVLAAAILDYLDGVLTDDAMSRVWDAAHTTLIVPEPTRSQKQS